MNNQEFQLKKMALAVKGMFAMAAIIAAFAFLVQSASPAVAEGPNQTYSTGKYMMSLQAVLGSDNQMNFYTLVWDTETGRSKMYYGSVKRGSITAASSSFNLPSSPL